MGLITIARYSDPMAAHLAKTRLEAEGIPVFVVDEHTVTMKPVFGGIIGIRIQVPEEYARQAVAILDSEPQAGGEEEGGDRAAEGDHAADPDPRAGRRPVVVEGGDRFQKVLLVLMFVLAALWLGRYLFSR